jgi:hypothetical protein
MGVVLLAIDEVPLTAAAIRWTINTVVKAGDILYIASCAIPNIPVGRSVDNFAAIRRQAAKELEIRLRAITQIVCEETRRHDFELKVDVELSKLDQSDHVIALATQLDPKKIVLFLAEETQPWLSRMLVGSVASLIRSKVSVVPTVLTNEMVQKLEDNDIWNVGIMV